MDRRFKLARFSLVFFALGMIGIIDTGFSSALLFIFLCLALGSSSWSMPWSSQNEGPGKEPPGESNIFGLRRMI